MDYMDLHLRSLIRMSGGVIYREMPPVTDMRGYVSPVLMPSGKRMLLLEPGFYIVNFAEVCPFDAEENNLLDVHQYELNLAGARLSINTAPFCGTLEVWYPMQIEENAKLVKLCYKAVAPKYDIPLE